MPNTLRNQIIVAGAVLIVLSVTLTGLIGLAIRFNDPLSEVDEQFKIRSEILNKLSARVIEDGNWSRVENLTKNLSNKFSIRIVLATEDGSVIVDTLSGDRDENLVGIGLIDPSNPLFSSTDTEISQLDQITKLNRAMATCLKEAGIQYTVNRNAEGIIRVFPRIQKQGDLAASRGCFFSIPAAIDDGKNKEFPDSMAVYVGVDNETYWHWIYLSSIGVLGIIVVFGSTVWFSRKIARPLESLTGVAKRISEGDFAARVDSGGSNEIDQFADSFNNMAEQLGDASDRRRKFMSDISHEIRSPLTNIRGHLEAITDGMEELSNETIGSMNSQVEQVSRLVEDLQQLSLADEGLLNIDKFPVVMDDIVEQISLANKHKLDEAGISLRITGGAPNPVLIDPLRVRQILQNLISNAIRHTPEEGRIEIDSQQDIHGVKITVRDTGIGISSYFLPHIFERFARDDLSRSRNTGGSGLGLSIALEITLAHNGNLTAGNHPDGGALFTLNLPS